MKMDKSALSANDIIKIIKQAKKSNVSDLDIKPDGSVSIKFGDNYNNKIVEDLEKSFGKEDEQMAKEMQEIQRAVEDERAVSLTQDQVDWLDLNNPGEVDEYVRLGLIKETNDGLVPSEVDKCQENK
jgi:5-methylcytosine-specific restriction endonuclease McrBC regulatory subunit McrC